MGRRSVKVTPAERAALREFVLRGTKGAAVSLGKSPHTVSHQLETARRRLGAGSSSEAAFLARVFGDEAI